MGGESFTPKLTATSRAKRGKLQKKEAQRAKETGIPNDNGKSGYGRKERGGPQENLK